MPSCLTVEGIFLLVIICFFYGGWMLIISFFQPRSNSHFSKTLPNHKDTLKNRVKYKNRFSYKHCILHIFSWVVLRNMFCSLKQHQQFFGTCFYTSLPESPPRLLCEASLCTQLQDQTNIQHCPGEQEHSAAVEDCQRKEDKKQWSNQDMEEKSAAQNEQKYQCRAA